MDMKLALDIVKKGSVENFMEYGHVVPMLFFVSRVGMKLAAMQVDNNVNLLNVVLELRAMGKSFILLSQARNEGVSFLGTLDNNYEGIFLSYYEHGKEGGACVAKIIRDEEVDRVEEWEDLFEINGKLVETSSKN